MEIGIFGGTFNPIHLGHLIVAENIRELFKLNRVYFIPSAVPPHKKGTILEGSHRLKMVDLATASNPYFVSSPLEVNRGGKSYTIDTILELQKKIGKDHRLHFIIGSDAFKDIATWKDYEQLLILCRFIIISRPYSRLKGVKKEISDIIDRLSLSIEDINCPYKNKEGLDHAKSDIIFINLPLIDISSTRVRNLVKRGKSIRYQVPEAVEQYINANRIYI